MLPKKERKDINQVPAANEKVMVRTYNAIGDADLEFFFDDIRDALKKYVKLKVQCFSILGNPDFRHRMSPWPTIWVRTGGEGRFRRVHDFLYLELTDRNIAKYLAERIIDGDELLDEFL